MPKTKKFRKLLKATKAHYVGKKVPTVWQEKYGKRYSEAEARRIAYAIAKKAGWRT